MEELDELLKNQKRQIKGLSREVSSLNSKINFLEGEINTKIGITEFNKVQEKVKSMADDLAKNKIVLRDTKIEIQKEKISINSPNVVIGCQ